MDIDKYKYVVRVEFNNAIMYYNSGHYMLVGNPYDATRYMHNDTESTISDKDYACCEGGQGSIILFADALIEFKKDNDE